MSSKGNRIQAPSKRPAPRQIRLARVRPKAQLTIPNIALEALGLQEGDDIQWVVEGDVVRLEPVEVQPRTPKAKEGTFREVMVRARESARPDGLVEGRGPRGRGWTRADAYE